MYIAAMSKVFLFVEIDVQPGKSAGFIEKLRTQAEVIRGESGCEFIDIYQNTNNENLVHVWEIWSDRGSWDAHMDNQASAAWREIAAGFVIGEKITVMKQA
jgi:autoinducer 2-degrading protein